MPYVAPDQEEREYLAAQGKKRCGSARGTGCQEIKDLSEFRKASRGWLGLHSRCIDCERKRERDAYAVSDERRERAERTAARRAERERRNADPEVIEARRQAACEATRKSYQKHIEKRRAEGREYRRSITQTCAVDGCDTRATSKAEGSLCDMHAWRLKRWGTTDDSGGVRADLVGPNHPLWGGDDISYTAAHNRIYNMRGKASEHACVDAGNGECSGRMEWSYNGGCSRERLGPNSFGVIMAYSPDPMSYAARCKSHHAIYDRNKNKNEENAA